jgi:DNA invertase Pin-like site-specific DNA recombinase
MAEGLFVAYYRVSTAQQGRSGLGLDAQRKAVTDYLNGGGWTLIAEHTEVESGKHADRPQLAAAMDMCRRTGARLLIAKLDRLSRDAHFLLGLQKAGIEFLATDMPHANRFTVHVMAALAEQEREMISARTKAALAAARARGVKLGGRRISRLTGLPDTSLPDWTKSVEAIQARTEARARDLAPVIARLQAAGQTSLRQLGRGLAEQHIRTLRDGQWSAAAVRNLLHQIATLDQAPHRCRHTTLAPPLRTSHSPAGPDGPTSWPNAADSAP